ncbi:CHASE2 domain-containing protein [Aliarcobacter cryaerophilus]|nr:CHASE2 domain-containing protein [Aliarcobacter cryaerophilus]
MRKFKMLFKNNYRKSILKASFVSIFFLFINIFYSIEIVRENIEDAGFDIMNKLVLNNIHENTNSSNVILFGFDDLYMKKENLFDEYNQPNYGYLFPRDKITVFIRGLDSFSNNINPINRPKVLFIDYDFSFSSLPGGKNISKEDKDLIEELKKDRDYIILIPKTSQANMIENSHDVELKQKIKDNKIIFVSVDFLNSKDHITRRYLGYKNMKDTHNNYNFYPNVSIVIWDIINNKELDYNKIKNIFKEKDVVSNRIIIKKYKSSLINNECIIHQSLWDKFTKYSAKCSLYDIMEEKFSNGIIILGATYNNNPDEFDTLSIKNFLEPIKGVELHANTLMTIFFSNGQLTSLDLKYGLIIVFFTIFLCDLFINKIFKTKFLSMIKYQYIAFLILTSLSFFIFSAILLIYYKIWFSWFIIIIIEFIYFILEINFLKKILKL